MVDLSQTPKDIPKNDVKGESKDALESAKSLSKEVSAVKSEEISKNSSKEIPKEKSIDVPKEAPKDTSPDSSSDIIITNKTAESYVFVKRKEGVSDDVIRDDLLKNGLDLILVDKLMRTGAVSKEKISKSEMNVFEKTILFILNEYVLILLFLLSVAMALMVIFKPAQFAILCPLIIIILFFGLVFGGLISMFLSIFPSGRHFSKQRFSTNFFVGLIMGLYLMWVGFGLSIVWYMIVTAAPVYVMLMLIYGMTFDEALPLMIIMTIAAFFVRILGKIFLEFSVVFLSSLLNVPLMI